MSLNFIRPTTSIREMFNRGIRIQQYSSGGGACSLIRTRKSMFGQAFWRFPIRHSDTLRILVVIGVVQGFSCDERVAPDSRTTHTKPHTMKIDPTPPERVSMIGYDGLDPAIRARDFARINENIRALEWPTREVFHPGSLEQFPFSAGTLRSTIEPVPIYAIVDPSAIEAQWKLLRDAAEPPPLHARDPYPPFDGQNSLVATVSFDPTVFAQTRFFSYPWPTWADGCLNEASSPILPILLDTKWTTQSTTYVGLTNLVGRALSELKVQNQKTFFTLSVSSTVWRVVFKPKYGLDNVWPRGELAFPLWDSTGILRGAHDDPWSNDRTGPMSTHVESPDFEWRILERSAFVLVKPIGPGYSQLREYVTLPESVARLSVPMVSVFKATTWKPLAEDYEFRLGPPKTTDDLLAVCVFMTCSDDQLREVATAMGRARPNVR